ncbi:mtDNA inheritance, partitioning of the mitochondrial organelle [Myotisia sp. PD_48]|nr:mtDNA inheritance, partitioning of the mitochondrial organelle [Myotisia sp. PD_48]
MHEVITLQLGQQSNYVATHFWNTQESYFSYSENEVLPVNHNIHFRAGIGADGTETFTPRTVIYDLKGGFGTLRKLNALYELAEQNDVSNGLWDGNEVVQKQPRITPNEYQKCLELGLPLPRLTSQTVRYWSDFNRLFYHPRSIVQLNEYDLNSQLKPFEDWTVGQSLFADLDKEHDLLDRDLRPFAEECDHLKSFQIFSGVDDAWGGFMARYIDNLKDEFGNKSILVWALNGTNKTERVKQGLANANCARSLSETSSQVSAYIPITASPSKLPEYITRDLSHSWYSSALISLAVESVSLPSRLRDRRALDIWDISAGDQRNIFNLQSSVGKSISAPIADVSGKLRNEEEQYDQLQEDMKRFDIDLSPVNLAMEHGTRIDGQVSVSRDSTISNLESLRPITRSTARGLQRYEIMIFLKFTDRAKYLNFYWSLRNDVQLIGSLISHSCQSSLEYPILDSSPYDLIRDQGPPGSTVKVNSALSISSQASVYLQALHQFVGRFVPLDEREELSNNLLTLSDVYRDGWESDFDSGDD